MLSLIIVRHGDAEPQIEGKDDKDRKLVKKGIKQMKRIATFLDEMGIKIDKVVSSPYLRAYQSAEAILDKMGVDSLKIETYDDLIPDKDPSLFIEKIKEFPDNMTVLIVGHEPYLSGLVKALTGGSVEIKKGGIAMIDYDLKENKGVLKMLLTQKVLKMI
ncbi:phosphohistidine phosphatase SixA [Sulfurisphaera ohwakuensis]|uniref:Phosphohistidine phosphatase n=1 Tax=Sulfurisphaera ohwakuensis TaxID=69656 RepID=A0A650CI83_SULOH|nr:phosphohistidine phosphatase SixA [Sulfurisphaera ohwakuensis]MBB5255074.1 phosphohistidine phosphatase [Sulfurisphaera ohwakuensis]QGR17257.1 phosphohistidine phosphatase SixA [Sulfurisphaera ohwakuensis]